MRREHPPLHISHQSAAPCDGCEFIAACRRDGHECKAFHAWIGSAVNAGTWKPEDRQRPHAHPMDAAEPATSLRLRDRNSALIAERTAVAAVCISAPTNPPHKAMHDVDDEIAIDNQRESEQPAEVRSVVSAIDSTPSSTSAHGPIASPAPFYETPSPTADEHAPSVSIVTRSDNHFRSSSKPVSPAQARWNRYFGPGGPGYRGGSA